MASPPLSLDQLLKRYDNPKPDPARFYNPAQSEHLQRVVRQHLGVVCQVQTPTGKGTGCLIGGNLLITNYHVIPDKKTAATSHAIFFRVTSQDVDKKNTTVKILRLKLDPSRFYYASPQKKEGSIVLAADAENLDFAIVALEPDPYLEEVKDRVFSIFNKIEPEMRSLTCILQHPEVIDAETSLQGDLKWSIGLVLRREDCAIHYDTETAPGSSGGAVMDEKGHLIALHYQGLDNCGCDPRHPNCNSGVLITEIAKYLEPRGERVKIEEHIKTYQKEYAFRENRFIEALRSYYKSCHEIPLLFAEDEKLPIQNYSQLAIIGDGERQQKRQKLEEKGTPEGKTAHEALFEAKKPIELASLYEDESLKDSSEKRVLILGGAGAGKSTLCQYIAYQWAIGKLWPQFRAVFWVKLRHLNKGFYSGDTYTAFDLLWARGSKLEEYKSLLEDEKFRTQTLLILDGYDELSSDAEQGHLGEKFKELKNLFHHILITSRPQRVHFGEVREKCTLEILGLETKSIDKYVEDFFYAPDDQFAVHKRNLQSYLKKTLIHSLAHIPLNLAILCRLFKEMQNPFDKNQPITVTYLYEEITTWLCKRFLLRPAASRIQRTQADILEEFNPQNLPEAAPIIRALQELAWEAMRMDKHFLTQGEIQTSFRRVKLSTGDNRNFGLFNIDLDVGSFIHLTFQEYFAARYLGDLYLDGKGSQAKDLIAEHKFTERFFPVFWMTAGYLSMKDDNALKLFFSHLLSEPYDLAFGYELRLLGRCFEECRNLKIIPEYEDFIDEVLIYLRNNLNEKLKLQLFLEHPKLFLHEKIITFFQSEHLVANQENALDLLISLAKEGLPLSREILLEIVKVLRNSQIALDIKKKAILILERVAEGKHILPDEVLEALVVFSNEPRADSIDSSMDRMSAVSVLLKTAKNGQNCPQDTFKVLAAVTLEYSKISFDCWQFVHEVINELAVSRPALFIDYLEGLIVRIKDRMKSGTKEALIELFKANDTKEVALMVLFSIAGSGTGLPKDVLEALKAIANDVNAAYEIKRISTLIILKDCFAKKEQSVSVEALEMLIGLIKDPKTESDLKKFMAFDMRGLAENGKIATKEAVDVLIRTFKDPGTDSDLKQELIMVIGEVVKNGCPDVKEALNVLIGLIKDPETDSKIKLSAIFAIGEVASKGQFSFKEILEILVGLIKDSKHSFDPLLYEATKALLRIAKSGQQLPDDALETLVVVLRHPKVEYEVKSSAAEAICEMAKKKQSISENGLQALISFLKDEHAITDAKKNAALVIAEIAKCNQHSSENALKALIEILNDPKAGSFEQNCISEALEGMAENVPALQKLTLEGLIAFLKTSKGSQEIQNCAMKSLQAIVKGGQDLLKEDQDMIILLSQDPKASSLLKRSVVEILGLVIKKRRASWKNALLGLISLLNIFLEKDVKQYLTSILKEVAAMKPPLPEDAIEMLIKLVNDEKANSEIKEFAVLALAQMKEQGRALPRDAIEVLNRHPKNPKRDAEIKRVTGLALREAPEDAIDSCILSLVNPLRGGYDQRSAVRILERLTKDGLLSNRALAQLSSSPNTRMDVTSLSYVLIALTQLVEPCSKFSNKYDYKVLGKLFYLTGRPFFYHNRMNEFYSSEKTPLITGSLDDRQKIYQEFLQGSKLHPKVV